MALLLGSKNNKLIDLIHKGGVNYGESLIPLTPGAIVPTSSNISSRIRFLKRRRRKSSKRTKRTKSRRTKRTRKSRRKSRR